MILNFGGFGLSKTVLMDKKRDILEREDLHRNPYSVPEGYFDQLQQRLGAIPRQAAAERNASAFFSAGFESASVHATRTRILPALAWAAGVAAMLAAGVFLFRGSGYDPEGGTGMSEVVSFEQLAYADLIPIFIMWRRRMPRRTRSKRRSSTICCNTRIIDP